MAAVSPAFVKDDMKLFTCRSYRCVCLCVDVSSELEAMLKQELEHTERLDAHFVEYLRCRGMSPADNTDSAAGSMHESHERHERLAPELQVNMNIHSADVNLSRLMLFTYVYVV